MKKLISALSWLAVIFCFLCLPAYGFHVCNIFFTLAGILFIPDGRLGRALSEHLKIKPAFIYLTAAVFLVIGVFIAPWPALSGENTPAQTTNTSVTAATSATSSSDISTTSATEAQASAQTTQTTIQTSQQPTVQTAPQTTAQSTVQTTPVSVTYILNTSSKKIHYSTCSHVSSMSEANKAEYTGDFSELLEQGYETCKTCFK